MCTLFVCGKCFPSCCLGSFHVPHQVSNSLRGPSSQDSCGPRSMSSLQFAQRGPTGTASGSRLKIAKPSLGLKVLGVCPHQATTWPKKRGARKVIGSLWPPVGVNKGTHWKCRVPFSGVAENLPPNPAQIRFSAPKATPRLAPSEHPNPTTKIGSKKGGEFT